jgi:hypothetical protein
MKREKKKERRYWVWQFTSVILATPQAEAEGS